MLSPWGMLNRIIHFFFCEFLNVFPSLLWLHPHLLTFALRMPPTDVLQGRMQIRFSALLESLQWIDCTEISPPLSPYSIFPCGRKGKFRLAKQKSTRTALCTQDAPPHISVCSHTHPHAACVSAFVCLESNDRRLNLILGLVLSECTPWPPSRARHPVGGTKSLLLYEGL